jgi:tRNA(Arg) A34 adenosine deaminase TadA
MHEDYLREAIRLAIEGVSRGDGGPFGSVIVREGAIIGRGWNRVLLTNDPTAHAEVVAIREACALLGNYHLTGSIVYASCEPCPMCHAACYWAQCERVYYAATAIDAAAAGFADDFIRRDLIEPLESRKLILAQMLPGERLQPFNAWQAKADRKMY